MTLWFEDIPLNQIFPLGEHIFTHEEIIEFGKSYDPQYFHVSPDLAEHSQFGGLIASGWHTVCVGHQIMVQALAEQEVHMRANGLEPGVSGPSPGVNSMDFKAPVRAGDCVTYTMTVTSKRASKSWPGWGLLNNFLEARNQHGALVYQSNLVGFTKMRDFKPSLRQWLKLTIARIPLLRKFGNK